MKFRIIILFFTILTQCVSAKEITILNSLDGLSQNDVNFIFQDSQGYVWIGTNDGLNRYDGYNFTIYRKLPYNTSGLRSNIINTIVEDKLGNIWVGSATNGVSRFDILTETFTSVVESDQGYISNAVSGSLKLFLDNKGKIWVLNKNRILVVDPLTFTVSNVELPLDIKEGLCTMFQNDGGNIILGTTKGLIELDTVTHEVISKKDFGMPVLDIITWNKELIFINKYGLYAILNGGDTIEKINEIKGGTSLINAGNTVWISLLKQSAEKLKLISRKKNLTAERDKTWSEVVNKIGSFNVSSMLLDNTGLLWLGTSGSGIRIYNANEGVFNHYKPSEEKGSLSNLTVRSIAEDTDANLWIGTENGDLSLLRNDRTVNYNNGFKTLLENLDFVTVLYSDRRNDKIWVGFPSGLKVFDAKTGKENLNFSRKLPKIKSIFSIHVDSNNIVWIGTYGKGVFRLVKNRDGSYTTVNFKYNGSNSCLSSNIVRSVLEDHLSNIWIGTGNGLNKIKATEVYKNEIEFITYKNDLKTSSSISDNYILPLFESSNKDLWIGTLGGGLNRLKKDANGLVSFESFTTVDGFPNNSIKGILEDENGNLWISSNKGISCFNPITKKIRNFGVNHGLQADEFRDLSACKRISGEMVFGGVNGINTFYPENVSMDTTLVEVVLTSLEIFNKPISIGEEFNNRVVLKKSLNLTNQLQLNYDENSFTIHFSGLHFAAPKNNYYKYKLEGFDSEWVHSDPSSRIAKYTNLNPGTYQLKVVAANSDGFWNKEEKCIQIQIGSPWWFSNSALIIYLILILVILWFFRRYTIIGLQRKNLLEMESFEKEKIQKLSQMKLKFFTNISHEFRTPLTLILGPITKLLREVDQMSEEKKNETYEVIHRNADRMLRLINQLMDFRKFEQNKLTLEAKELDLVVFVSRILKSFYFEADQKKIQLLFESDEKDLFLWFDPEKMEKVLMNLLSNAFKYSCENGSVTVKLVSNKTTVDLIVQDNGIGIPLKQQKKVFNRFYQADKINDLEIEGTGIGLAFTKGLVDLHYGTICLKSSENGGSTFAVTLKKGIEHLKPDEMNREKEMVFDNLKLVNETRSNGLETTSKNENLKKEFSVLVVEDNLELRKFIVDNLKSRFYVSEAGNGKEAIECCNIDLPDIIVSDVMMPVMDGFEMCRELKSNLNFSHVPIVLLTAKTANENKVKGYNLGANGYVEKPFDFEVLLAQIESLLDHKKRIKEKFQKSIEVVPFDIVTTKVDDELLRKILAEIENSFLDRNFSVRNLAAVCGMSTSNLNKKLKALTGKTSNGFVRSVRLKKAASLLVTGRYSVTDVTYEVGFSDLKYFRQSFKEEFDMSPSEYKKRNK